MCLDSNKNNCLFQAAKVRFKLVFLNSIKFNFWKQNPFLCQTIQNEQKLYPGFAASDPPSYSRTGSNDINCKTGY